VAVGVVAVGKVAIGKVAVGKVAVGKVAVSGVAVGLWQSALWQSAEWQTALWQSAVSDNVVARSWRGVACSWRCCLQGDVAWQHKGGGSLRRRCCLRVMVLREVACVAVGGVAVGLVAAGRDAAGARQCCGWRCCLQLAVLLAALRRRKPATVVLLAVGRVACSWRSVGRLVVRSVGVVFWYSRRCTKGFHCCCVCPLWNCWCCCCVG
jgi:hypothetical protein